MSIADDYRNTHQAPSGAAWLEFNAWLRLGLVALLSMPLLTEPGSNENGFCYRHGAPDGAVMKAAPDAALRAAKAESLCVI
jgi:hypothetical protein